MERHEAKKKKTMENRAERQHLEKEQQEKEKACQAAQKQVQHERIGHP